MKSTKYFIDILALTVLLALARCGRKLIEVGQLTDALIVLGLMMGWALACLVALCKQQRA